MFEVLDRYDPGNLLLEQARREILERQLEVSRLRETLDALAERPLVMVDLHLGKSAAFRAGERMMCGSVRVVHDPQDVAEDGVLTITGHWHPVVRIKDGKRTALRLPCFLLRGDVLVLPSFGSFTGGQIVAPMREDRIFVGMREDVVEVPFKVISER